MIKKIIIGLIMITCFGLFTGCVDYGYSFHFSVDGGNGEVTIDTTSSYGPTIYPCRDGKEICELECAEGSHYVVLRGSKNGGQQLTFIATPDEGYQVKEWLFNGKIVEGNNTNTYTAIVTSEHKNEGVIAVRFEPIPSHND